MTENPPANGPSEPAGASGWPGWWSWPPGGDVTPMPGAQLDDLLATAGEPDPAPRLVGLMGRQRRFVRCQYRDTPHELDHECVNVEDVE